MALYAESLIWDYTLRCMAGPQKHQYRHFSSERIYPILGLVYGEYQYCNSERVEVNIDELDWPCVMDPPI